jgi:hypothetical protein
MIIWEKLDPEKPPHFGDLGLLVLYEDSRLGMWMPHAWSVRELVEMIVDKDEDLPTHYSQIQWPRGTE